MTFERNLDSFGLSHLASRQPWRIADEERISPEMKQQNCTSIKSSLLAQPDDRHKGNASLKREGTEQINHCPKSFVLSARSPGNHLNSCESTYIHAKGMCFRVWPNVRQQQTSCQIHSLCICLNCYHSVFTFCTALSTNIPLTLVIGLYLNSTMEHLSV